MHWLKLFYRTLLGNRDSAIKSHLPTPYSPITISNGSLPLRSASISKLLAGHLFHLCESSVYYQESSAASSRPPLSLYCLYLTPCPPELIRISLMVSAVLRHWIPSRWWPKTYGPTSDSAVVYPTNPSIQSTISFPGPSVCTLGYDSLPGGGADSSGIKEHSSRAAANDRLNSFFQNLSMSLPITPYIRWSKTHLFYDE